MARFNRVNLDGKSVTETRTSAVDVLPGTALKITSDKFVVSTDGLGATYIANTGHLQGLGADDAIPKGDSIEGEYLETGRGMAVLVAATTVVTMDMPLTVGAGGVFSIATSSDSGSPEVPAVPSTYTSGGAGAVADFSGAAAVTFKVNDVQVALDADLTDTEGVVAAISGQLTGSGVAATGTNSIVLTNSAGTGITVQAMTGSIDAVFGDAPVYVAGSPLVPAVPAGTDPVLAYAKEDYTVGDTAELVWVRGA